MKTILVTGGAGLIGSHLCEKLVEGGNNVICVDNLLTGSQKNIAHLLTNKNFSFVNQDVCNPLKIKKGVSIDEIYHLASPADPNVKSPISYITHPFETMKVNTIGTWNMCEIALKHRANLLLPSTSEIYGDPQISPQTEEYRGNVSTTGPRSVYDESKRFGETIVSAFVRLKGLNARTIRIFNTYGPRMNIKEGRAVVNFIKQAIKNEPMTIYGDGKQTRSFCYIDDQIEGQILAMNKGESGQVYNLGNHDERTIIDFAELIKKLAKSKSKIVFSQKLPEDDPVQRNPDITKAKDELGWKPKVKIEEGLLETIAYFKKISA